MPSKFAPTLAVFRPGHLVPVILLLLVSLAPGTADDTNIFPSGSFNDVEQSYVPWAGVDSNSNIHCIDGQQLLVNEAGKLMKAPFGPSVAVADLNGDGKNDLIVADSFGYFWYFPNTGTAQNPAFTQGEVMPIWLGEPATQDNPGEGVDNVVPRIQLVDFNGSGKLDIVAGTYSGKLFHIPNIGSSTQPNFRPTVSLDSLIINTHRRGALWCNYLAPFFTTAFSGGNIYDLITGEGTYSANSIWFLHNTGANDRPEFDEDPAHFKRLIPGMGLEQLTPQVVDWNNDGKPDIITGDRLGYISLFLNNSTDPANPTFAPGVHVQIAGQESMGGSITVTVCDLSNNKLPNLLIGRDDGTLLYAVNHGTLGNPQFPSPATPLKGVLPQGSHYMMPRLWHKWGGFGAAYEMLGVTNPQLEPGFTFPEGVNSTYALRFWIWPSKDRHFQLYYPPEEDRWTEHVLDCSQGVTLKMNTRYKLHFWVMAPDSSVTSFRYALHDTAKGEGQQWVPPGVYGDIDTTSQWTEVTRDFEIDNDPDPTVKEYGYGFQFRFQGQEPFYIDDLRIDEEKD